MICSVVTNWGQSPNWGHIMRKIWEGSGGLGRGLKLIHQTIYRALKLNFLGLCQKDYRLKQIWRHHIDTQSIAEDNVQAHLRISCLGLRSFPNRYTSAVLFNCKIWMNHFLLLWLTPLSARAPNGREVVCGARLLRHCTSYTCTNCIIWLRRTEWPSDLHRYTCSTISNGLVQTIRVY